MLPQYATKMNQVLLKYQAAKRENRILMLDFVTLPDYLFKLQAGAKILARLERQAMYYLAAAVSDFFIPSQKMVNVITYYNTSLILKINSLF